MALDFKTALFASKPLDFLRARAINPPAQDDARLAINRPIALDDRSLRFFSQSSKIKSQRETLQGRFESAEVKVPIAWIRLLDDPVFPGACTFDLEFASGDVDARIDRTDRLPIYYLPWMPDKFVRMTIPAYREENVADFGIGTDRTGKTSAFLIDSYNPHLFFTAGLTGCSVFVYGDPRRPTVTHVGTQTDTPYGDDCALFWRELLLLERFQRLHHEGLASEVNVDQYMGETRSVGIFRRWLSNRPEKFTIQSVCAYGAVFGLRYGSLWSFYLQESAFVEGYKVVQQKRQRLEQLAPDFSLPEPLWYRHALVTETVTVRKDISKTIPLSVHPFFPKGSGSARFRWTFKNLYG
jgi:hypothetical protein